MPPGKVSEELLRALLVEREALAEVEGRTIRQLEALLRDARSYTVDRLAEIDTGNSLQEAEGILADIRRYNRGIVRQMTSVLSAALIGIYVDEVRFTEELIRRVHPNGDQLNPVPTDEEASRKGALGTVHGVAPGAALASSLNRIEDRIEREIRDRWSEEAQHALDRNDPEVLRTRARLGVGILAARRLFLDRGRYDMKVIVEAHSGAAFDRAVRSVGALNRHLAGGYQHSAELDDRTCSECAGLDGKIYYYDRWPSIDTAPELPLHPNCRCIRSLVAIDLEGREI